jgi:hypothetical protein
VTHGLERWKDRVLLPPENAGYNVRIVMRLQ